MRIFIYNTKRESYALTLPYWKGVATVIHWFLPIYSEEVNFLAKKKGKGLMFCRSEWSKKPYRLYLWWSDAAERPKIFNILLSYNFSYVRCLISYLNLFFFFLILNLGFKVDADLMGCNCGLKLKLKPIKKWLQEYFWAMYFE